MKSLNAITLLLVVPLAISCSTLPDWIHQPPPGPAAVPVEQMGLWQRVVRSRFPNSSRSAWSRGAESILITAGGRYAKLHLYDQRLEGERTIEGYYESGLVSKYGKWLLFTPELAMNMEPVVETITPGTNIRNPIQLPPIEQLHWQDRDIPEPLLFYMSDDGGTIIPLASERMGREYSFGLYEGTANPYDDSGESFRQALERNSQMRHQPHAYFRSQPESGRGKMLLHGQPYLYPAEL